MYKFKDVHIGRKEPLFIVSNLHLEKGKLYTLIGKNGIGKSTFLNTILGTIPVFKGFIETTNLQPKEKQIAFVPSKFEGIEFLNTREYISLGRAPHTNFLGKLNDHDFKIIDTIIERLGIKHLEFIETIKLSDGERQIASIGRALAQETEAILLDEPLAFLDYENKIKILQLLREISEKEHKCIIYSSHDIELCLKYTNEILIIKSSDKNLMILNKEIELEQIVSLAFNN